MAQAAVDLVRTIREAYPHLKLIMNRGYVLLPQVINSIDAIIAESLLTSDSGIQTATPGGGGYVWNKPDSVAEQLSLLMPARDRNLPVLSLDYWEPTDIQTSPRFTSASVC
jgi:polysaccharide biosynthesis protein PelA